MKATYRSPAIFLFTLSVLSSLAWSQNTPLEQPKITETKETVLPGSLTAILSNSATFTTLTKALKAAELDLTLGSQGEFTIFAPSDEAFAKLPTALLTKLMLPENKGKLRSLLLYHVIADKVLTSELKNGDLKTMNGERVLLKIDSDKVEIGDAKVFNANLSANNGIIHSIGKVLVPKSLNDFVALDK